MPQDAPERRPANKVAVVCQTHLFNAYTRAATVCWGSARIWHRAPKADFRFWPFWRLVNRITTILATRPARPARLNAATEPGQPATPAGSATAAARPDDEPGDAGVLAPAPQALRDLDARLTPQRKVGNAPHCGSFAGFLGRYARVLQRDGTGGAFTLQGRAPLALIVDWLDKVLRNTVGAQGQAPETVEIDGTVFAPGLLKGTTLAVAGGAQFGKTVLELNLMAYATAIRFLSVGNYLPDRPKVEEIVGQKFRPNVLDLYPWMAEMIQIGKTQNASGKTIDRKESYTVTDGERKSFGNFCGMHKPPTSITIDLALLDEVDDIPDRNIGYVDARMTNSPVHLTCFIGTQRVSGAGQNARLKASSFHVKMVPCPNCGREWCLEEEFPRCVRVRRPHTTDHRPPPDGHSPTWRAAVQAAGKEMTTDYTDRTDKKNASPSVKSVKSVVTSDPIISPEQGHDRLATYYVACPECGTELDRDAGRYVAKHPERIAQARLGVRVSQLNISAISMQEIVGAWYAAFEDPSGNALAAFCCDRIAIPNAGAAQPITQAVLDNCRKLGLGETLEASEPYAMSLTPAIPHSALRTPHSRVAGMDMGPRCWFWCDEVRGPLVSACLWAELIASGNAPTRVPILMQALGIQCLFMDAGGEPDLTKRLVLALNGLEAYQPPILPKTELLKSRLYNIGAGLHWDGERAKWRHLRAAAVLFVSGEARGVEQTIGFTQEGRIYPLIKCNRAESIQTAVNDFLSPAEGVIEMAATDYTDVTDKKTVSPSVLSMQSVVKSVRTLRRARLPQTYIGPGVSQAILDGHLLNLRKERDPRTGAEDWIEGVENHLGLAKCYARLAQSVADTGSRLQGAEFAPIHARRPTIGRLGLGRLKGVIAL